MEFLVLLIILVVGYTIIMPLVAIVKASSIADQFRSLETKLLAANQRIYELELLIKKLSLKISDDQEPKTSDKTADAETEPLSKIETFSEEPQTSPEEKTDDTKTTPLQAAEQKVVEEVTQKTSETPETTSANTTQTDTATLQKQETKKKPATPVKTAKPSFEERLGAQWTIWVGGLALALGAVFLVKYSIEQGLIGPAVRIFLATLLSITLLTLGEVMRRAEKKENNKTKSKPENNLPHIPGMLTAAGIIAAFATIYASYFLYHFLNPSTAFVMLGAVSLASMFLAALHGPGLSAIGLIGGFATPALISTDTPNGVALFTYLGFLGSVSLILSSIRREYWIAVSATAGSIIWTLLWIYRAWAPSDLLTLSIFILTLMAVAYLSLQEFTKKEKDQNQNWQAIGILTALSFLMFPVIRISGLSDTSLILIAITTSALLLMALRANALSPLALWSGALFCLTYLTWNIPVLTEISRQMTEEQLAAAPWYVTAIPTPTTLVFLGIGGVFGAVFLIAGFLIAMRRDHNRYWTITATAAPVIIFLEAYWRTSNFGHNIQFGLFGLLVVGLYVALSEYASRNKENQPAMWASGVYAAAAVSVLGLACPMFLEKGWLTISFSLISLGLAWITTIRPVPGLRYLAVIPALIVLIRLLMAPVIMGPDLGALPVFNWFLYGYGVPVIAFGATAWLLRKSIDDWVVSIFETLSVIFLLTLVTKELHHFMTNGNVAAPVSGIAEMSLHVITWLGISLALQYHKPLYSRPVFRTASYIIGGIGLLAIFIGLYVLYNPAITNIYTANFVLMNTFGLAYLLPAVICLLIFFQSEKLGAQNYANIFALGALALLCTYVYFEIHHVMSSGNLGQPVTELREFSILLLCWLTISLGIQLIRPLEQRPVFNTASLAMGWIGMASIIIGSYITLNPLHTGTPVGSWPLFNTLAIGYLLPALICLGIHYASQQNRSELYQQVFGINALVMTWAYISLEVRRAFHGPFLNGGYLKTELYAYSAAWLIFGVVILALAFFMKSRSLRLASGAIVMLTVCKVFLFDLSNLTGLLRALSFIGLGGTLVAIGYVYQKFILPGATEPAKPKIAEAQA